MIPKNELRWYLFEDSVQILENFGYPRYREDFMKHMNIYLSYYPFIKTGNILTNIIPSHGKKNKGSILAHHLLCRYPQILKSISQEYNLTIMAKTPLSITYALKNRLDYISLHEIYKDLYQGIINDREDQLKRSFENLKTILLYFKPQFLLVNHDVHPEDRLMVLAAKELEIPTIEIQHGIYSSSNPIVTGKEVDFVFVWGKFFKDIYIKQKIKEHNQIQILGYPRSLIKLKKSNNIKLRTLVYIGQPFERTRDELFEVKVDTIKQLQHICGKMGLKFSYRPHPSDNVNELKKKLHNIKFISKREALTKTFLNNEIFISFNSTALIEAALNSRLCIQLKNFDLKTDDFEKLGICKSYDNIEDLEKEIRSIIKSNYFDNLKPVHENYIMVPAEGPGKKFLDLIKIMN